MPQLWFIFTEELPQPIWQGVNGKILVEHAVFPYQALALISAPLHMSERNIVIILTEAVQILPTMVDEWRCAGKHLLISLHNCDCGWQTARARGRPPVSPSFDHQSIRCHIPLQ